MFAAVPVLATAPVLATPPVFATTPVLPVAGNADTFPEPVACWAKLPPAVLAADVEAADVPEGWPVERLPPEVVAVDDELPALTITGAPVLVVELPDVVEPEGMTPPVMPVLTTGALAVSTTVAETVSRLTTGVALTGTTATGAATTLPASTGVATTTTGAVTTREESVVFRAWLLSTGTVRLSATTGGVTRLSATGTTTGALTGPLFSEEVTTCGTTTTEAGVETLSTVC